ncbi:MAG TPA: chemotaxis protein CheW [Motilibacteraceae bacterium]|nr:chemotaxis protein CheW [Motilibacteraceae bacterium]
MSAEGSAVGQAAGHVTFRCGGRVLAAALEQVREVVRAGGVEPLAGARAPVTSLLVLRGDPLPVVDLRSGGRSTGTDHQVRGPGDVLVLADVGEHALGVAVDAVLAVHGAGELATVGAPVPAGLPAYVDAVLLASGAGSVGDVPPGEPVFLVDLRRLAQVPLP